MRVSRDEFLGALQSVSPGLSVREETEQSTCVVFTPDGRMITFNEEVCASRRSLVHIVGAVKAKTLMDMLAKLPDDVVDVSLVDGFLEIVTKSNRKAGFRAEAAITLPVENVDAPGEWSPLGEGFNEAIQSVHSCASRDTSQDFCWTCIHLCPEYIEATDRSQIARYSVSTGLQEEMIVRADSLRRIVGYGMSEISVTNSWLHFRNVDGLTLSVRRYLDEYGDLSQYLEKTNATPIVLPRSLPEILVRVEISTSETADDNYVTVDLKPGWMLLEGWGASSFYKERTKMTYDGPAIRFRIAPKLLTEIVKRSSDCSVTTGKLFIDGGKFQYVSSLMQAAPSKRKTKEKPEA